jgi:hypothetical protein
VQELESLLTALDWAGRTQGCAQRTRGAEGARQPEFLCTEPAGLVQQPPEREATWPASEVVSRTRT